MSTGSTGNAAQPAFVERLTAPASLWAGAAAFAAVLGITVQAALGPVAGLVALAVPAVAAVVLLTRAAAEVRVDGTDLVAGPARIPVDALGPVQVLDADQARAVRGPQSDPAAFHLIRGWIPTGVLAEVRDPADPTPYWFIASRRPRELAAAVEAARTAPQA